MIPAFGLNAGAGKAGLIQSSATCSSSLECRKVLFRQKVTAIHRLSFPSIPASETACEFAVDALVSIVTRWSKWMEWNKWGNADPGFNCAEFVRHVEPRVGPRSIRSAHAEREAP
jgi:hypothetical protein